MTSLRVITTKTNNFFNLCGSQRCYSVYPSYYIKPIYKKEEQRDLRESNKIQELVLSHIKPPTTSDTSSEFCDKNVNVFTNYVLRKGKKALARSLVTKTFENIKRIQVTKYHKADLDQKNDIELDPKVIFHKAVENCTPALELTNCRKGGINYKVPVAVHESRAKFLAMNWLIQAAKTKHRTKHFPENLAKQLIDAFHNQGHVIMRKQDLHKECDANRAYAHFRWQK